VVVVKGRERACLDLLRLDPSGTENRKGRDSW
jgi:hypothetical protein